ALVQRQGVAVKKKSPNILMMVNLVSELDPETGRPRYGALELSNYATIQIRDELARLPGVGDVAFLAQRDYSMRAWLDPEKMASLHLTADDVVASIRRQNAQVAAGQIGQPPAPRNQDFQLTISTLGRLVESGQFADIILKAGPGGPGSPDAAVVRLRDV